MILAHPVRWAIIAYALFTVIFFIVPIFSPGKMIYGSDTMSAGVFFRSFYADFWRDNFRVPLWDPYIHGGLPFVDAMHGDIFYPAAILQIILPVTYAIGLKLILHVFLAGVFMFLFLRTIGRSDQTSFIGGALYMFAPCLVSLFYPGHDGKIYVMALTPLAFLLVHRGVVTRRLAPFLWFGLVYALMILTAHVQMAYYASWGLGLYFSLLALGAAPFRFREDSDSDSILCRGSRAGNGGIVHPMAGAIPVPRQVLATNSAQRESWWLRLGQFLVDALGGTPLGRSIPRSQGGSRRPSVDLLGQNFFKLNSEAVGVYGAGAGDCGGRGRAWTVDVVFAGLSLLTLLPRAGGDDARLQAVLLFRADGEEIPRALDDQFPLCVELDRHGDARAGGAADADEGE